METLSSKAVTTETASQLEQPETQTSPEQTASDARTHCKATLEMPRVTFNNLLNDLELCMQKSLDGGLNVSALEQLVADFSTYLTYTPLEKHNGLSDSIKTFYSQLRQVVFESVSNENVTGDQDRKSTLYKFADGLHHKVSFYTDPHTSNNTYESLNGFVGCIGG